MCNTSEIILFVTAVVFGAKAMAPFCLYSRDGKMQQGHVAAGLLTCNLVDCLVQVKIADWYVQGTS